MAQRPFISTITIGFGRPHLLSVTGVFSAFCMWIVVFFEKLCMSVTVCLSLKAFNRQARKQTSSGWDGTSSDCFFLKGNVVGYVKR